jgi:hypothetical protein
MEFEPAIPASKMSQIYTLDRNAAGTNNVKIDKLIAILSKMVYSLTLLTCILKPTSSNLGEDTGCF